MDEKILRALKKDPKVLSGLMRAVQMEEKENKYHVADVADRTYSNGVVFASREEMLRWDYLLKIEQAGEIKDLQRQVPFVLQKAFMSGQYGIVSHILYVADFVYVNLTFRKGYPSRKVVEDSKTGVRTGEYKNKRKMFLYKYPEYLFFEV